VGCPIKILVFNLISKRSCWIAQISEIVSPAIMNDRVSLPHSFCTSTSSPLPLPVNQEKTQHLSLIFEPTYTQHFALCSLIRVKHVRTYKSAYLWDTICFCFAFFGCFVCLGLLLRMHWVAYLKDTQLQILRYSIPKILASALLFCFSGFLLLCGRRRIP